MTPNARVPRIVSFAFVLSTASAAVVALTACSSVDAAPDAGDATVKISRGDGKLRVEIGGELFTEYLYEGNNKPILYPVLGPGGTSMTRHFPMRDDVPGEAHDHPHHRSLWFTHGDVNDVSFWHEGENAGKTVHDEFLEIASGKRGVIKAKNRWVDADGKVHCTDTRTLTFSTIAGARVVDIEVTLEASAGKVVLGDTKEGTMGIRTHPNLRLANSPARGVTTANGQALNSAGHRNKELWGKRAAWVDYWGTIEGKTVGVAIFDHPTNPRHPTWWHARDYGLVAANPFGVHDFEKKPDGTGDLTIEANEQLAFRYRFVFHEGDAEAARIAERYAEFAETSRTSD